jgi:hypothetical protein
MKFSTSGTRALRLRVVGLIAIGGGAFRLDETRGDGRGFLEMPCTWRPVKIGFFEVRCGASFPLPFSLFLALFLEILPVARLSDELRALGEYRFLLTDFPIPSGFMLEGVVFLFLTFMGEILAEWGRHDDRRGLAGVFFIFGVLLNCKQPPNCRVVFQLRRALTNMDLRGSSGPVNSSYRNQFTTQRLLPF